jgi:hypothetical protein
MSQRGVSDRSPVLWSRAEFLKATLVTMCAPVVVRLARAADNPVVRIAASRGVVSAPIWNVSNHASRYGFSVEMSVLFTYADQQRAAQNNQTELATTGINNPSIIADQGITNLRYVAGQQFGGQNLILRKNVMAETWKALEGKTIARKWCCQFTHSDLLRTCKVKNANGHLHESSARGPLPERPYVGCGTRPPCRYVRVHGEYWRISGRAAD